MHPMDAFGILIYSVLWIRIEGQLLIKRIVTKSTQHSNSTEIYLENWFSWHEPTASYDESSLLKRSVVLQSFTESTMDSDNLIESLSHQNLSNNLDINKFNLISNLSDLSYESNSTIAYSINNPIQNTTQHLFDNNSNANTLYDVPVHLIVLLALAYGLVSLTAVIGNSIVLWFVVRSRKLRTVTNIFIANLAISDILAIPFQFQAALLQRWVLPEIMCPFCSFVQIVSVNVSVGTLSAIAADRYLVVFYPIKYRISKRLAKFIIAFIWIFSVSAAIPALIALRVVYIPDLMNVAINEDFSGTLLAMLSTININSTSFPELAQLQNTLNATTGEINSLRSSSTSINSTLAVGGPTRATNTLFWIDDVLAKIDLMQNPDDKLLLMLSNVSLPLKAHCGNVELSVNQWKMYNLFLVLIQYFVPLIVILFAYTRMGLKLRETDRSMNKRNSSKLLQRLSHTTSSVAGFSSSSVRTTNNNNLIVSPGTAHQPNMAMELQQTLGSAQTTSQLANKRCRSLDCSPLEEGACLMNTKCTQQCTNSQQAHNLAQQQITGNVSLRKHRTSCTPAECFARVAVSKEALLNNNNEFLMNKNVSNNCNASIRKESCKCSRRSHEDDHHACVHQTNTCTVVAHHRQQQQSSQSPSQQSPSHPLQHHSSLQPTGSIHSNLMMPIISHPISALRVNPHAEYIVINKKKVIKMLFIVCSLFAFLWLPIQTYNLLKDFFFEINGYRYINVIWFVMHFMAMLSASTNPFVYAIYSVKNSMHESTSIG